MYDKRYVRFVDSHAESIGRHHDPLPIKDEIVLIFHPFFIVKPCVIPGRLKASGVEHIADSLHVFSLGAVHDPRLISASFQCPQKLLILAVGMSYRERKVWPVKGSRNRKRIFQIQQFFDILPHIRRCGRSERTDRRSIRKSFRKISDSKIARSKILTPLRNTMRFVDRQKRDLYLRAHF